MFNQIKYFCFGVVYWLPCWGFVCIHLASVISCLQPRSQSFFEQTDFQIPFGHLQYWNQVRGWVSILICCFVIFFICVLSWNQVQCWVSTDLLCGIFVCICLFDYFWNQVERSVFICVKDETRFEVGFQLWFVVFICVFELKPGSMLGSTLICCVFFFNSVREMFWRYHLRNVWIPIIVCIVLFCLLMLVTGCRSGSLYVSILPEKDFGPHSQNLRHF